jgi:hypothetical protein
MHFFPILLALAIMANTSLADHQGFDISQAQTADFWSCMRKDGYRKVNIRAYFQSCGSKGGAVDPNFMKSYNAAIHAGFKEPGEIDAYMFPCPCTSPRLHFHIEMENEVKRKRYTDDCYYE